MNFPHTNSPPPAVVVFQCPVSKTKLLHITTDFSTLSPLLPAEHRKSLRTRGRPCHTAPSGGSASGPCLVRRGRGEAP